MRIGLIEREKQKCIYISWCCIKQRCFNPKNANFKYYGGRASGPIQVCAQWSDFRLFWRDMEATWFPGASIDRIDNDGHYNRLNCKWSTPKETANNRRNEPQKGEKNGSAKLTWEAVNWMRFCSERLGWTQQIIAECNKVSCQNVGHILRNETWRL